MKLKVFKTLLLLLFIIVITSCSMQKRYHFSGYHVQWHTPIKGSLTYKNTSDNNHNMLYVIDTEPADSILTVILEGDNQIKRDALSLSNHDNLLAFTNRSDISNFVIDRVDSIISANLDSKNNCDSIVVVGEQVAMELEEEIQKPVVHPLSIISFVFGVLSIPSSFILLSSMISFTISLGATSMFSSLLLPLIMAFSFIGIITGLIALIKSKKAPGKYKSRLAKWGLILSFVGIAYAIGLLIFQSIL